MQCAFSFRHVHCVSLGYAFYILFHLDFFFLFFSSWPISFAFFRSFVFLFFCLSFSSSCPSASFSYFLLTDSLIISHTAPSASLLLSHSIFSDNVGRLYTVWLLVNVPFVFIFQSWFSYAYNDGCESATCNRRTAFHHIIIARHDKSRQPRGGALLAHLMLIVPSIYSIEVQVQYSRATSKSVTVWPLTRDATPRFVFTSLWMLIVSLFISISIVFTPHMPKTAALANQCETRCNTE